MSAPSNCGFGPGSGWLWKTYLTWRAHDSCVIDFVAHLRCVEEPWGLKWLPLWVGHLFGSDSGADLAHSFSSGPTVSLMPGASCGKPHYHGCSCCSTPSASHEVPDRMITLYLPNLYRLQWESQWACEITKYPSSVRDSENEQSSNKNVKQNEKLFLQACTTVAAHIEKFHLDKGFQAFMVNSFSDIWKGKSILSF